MRRFVIGDIHGCAKSLRTLIETIAPQSDDEVIFLGDYVDRGPSSRDVVDQIIQLKEQCRVVALRGNHEIMLMAAAFGGVEPTPWMNGGGLATVSSYGGSLRKIPAPHIAFFQELRPYYETEAEIFVHAGYDPDLPMREQLDSIIYWTHLPDPLPKPHCSGKRVFVGHTPQPFGQILNEDHLVCIDTYCFGNGYLSAMNVDTGDLIQVDRFGHLRRDPLADFFEQLSRGWSRCKKLYRRMFERRADRSVVASDTEEPREANDAAAEQGLAADRATVSDAAVCSARVAVDDCGV